MAQNCTILCPADNPKRAIDAIRELISDDTEIQVQGEDGNWSTIYLTKGGTSLTLNRLIQHEPGDKFSRMVLGMHNYFRQVKTPVEDAKRDVLSRIASMAMAIGIVAEPEFNEAANHFELIFGVAGALEAIIWNGNAVINSDGKLLLDEEGNCDVLDS